VVSKRGSSLDVLLSGIEERVFTSGLEERVFTSGLEEKGDPLGLCRERLANLPSPEPEASPNP
jgi:hypothetical protein